MSEDYQPYLDTLRRVPPSIILSVASRDINLKDGEYCLCGWVLREGLSRLRDVDAEVVATSDYIDSYRECVHLYGGSEREWEEIFSGVYREDDRRYPPIERAFVERVLEAVNA